MSEIAKTGAEEAQWDMSPFYESIEDPQIDKDVEQWMANAKAFRETHKGKLTETLGQALRDYAALSSLGNKFGVYFLMETTVDTGNQPAQSKKVDIDTKTSAASGEYLTFFELELVALDEASIISQSESDETVKKHLPWIAQVRKFKPHVLSEEVEGALAKRMPFGAGSWRDFFDEVAADLRFPWKEELIPLSQILQVFSESKDADERAEALKIVNDGLGGFFLKYSAMTLGTIVGSKAVEDSERGHKHPMQTRNMDNMVPDDVVEALHEAARQEAVPLAKRFYKLKAAHLGLDRLRWSDRNAPMPFSDTSVVPWEKATSTVVGAYRDFSPTLADLVSKMIDSKMVDAPATEGKYGGAYNVSFTLDGKPASFTLMNYQGSNRDVSTLAHELGHGVHGLLAGEAQGELMMHVPMAYAETASVFGEKITFNALRAEMENAGDKKALLALVMGKLDDTMNTVLRQMSFSEFERDVHGAGRRLSADELNEAWIKATKLMYGEDGEVFTYENISNLWTYVHHFYTPFYTYAYAFGELLTQSLYAARPALGDKFEPLYLDMLRAGNSKEIVDLLEPFGLDPTSPSFWADGIKVSMGALVDEAEKLSLELGVEVA